MKVISVIEMLAETQVSNLLMTAVQWIFVKRCFKIQAYLSNITDYGDFDIDEDGVGKTTKLTNISQ